MRMFVALGSALIALAGCGGGDTGNDSAAEADGAAQAGGSEGNGSAVAGDAGGGGGGGGAVDTIQPGLWEVTTQVAMTIPGMPEGAVPQREPETRRECISEQETRDMATNFTETQEGLECSRRDFTMRGGRMEGRMVCTQNGQEFRVAMNGDYSRTSFNVQQQMSGTVPGAEQPMTMQFQARGRRVGECPAGGGEEGGN